MNSFYIYINTYALRAAQPWARTGVSWSLSKLTKHGIQPSSHALFFPSVVKLKKKRKQSEDEIENYIFLKLKVKNLYESSFIAMAA